jgi:hypothetical protein
MSKKTKAEVKEAIAKARLELDKLEARVDADKRSVTDCSCMNPPCSGVEMVTYVSAVGASFLGGVIP